jgi:hypothetical protein
MTHKTSAYVLPGTRHLLAALVLVAAGVHWSTPAYAQRAPGERAFTGIYLGAEAGRVNVIGGALVSGVDTLAQDSRTALTFFGGGRYEFPARIVAGVELAFGVEDGDLRLEDPSASLTVDYRNSTHVRYGGTVGVVLGAARRTLLFGYVSENTRTFDVTIQQAGQTILQEDEQGLLRYGGGIEQRLTSRLGFRATMGSSRADFGGRPTNIAVERPLELAAGLVVRF